MGYPKIIAVKRFEEISRIANLAVVLALATATLLSGCVATFAQLYSDIPHYKGRNIDALIDRIGYPDSQKFINGRVVYTWTPASTVEPELRPMHAPPAGAPVGAPGTAIQATSDQPETLILHFRCTLQVDTDGTGTILSLSWKGEPRSCAP
jgi:hypothetical protein